MPKIPMWRRYARLFGADPAADVKDELQFHLESKVEDLVARGWTREAARAEAERQFGDRNAVERAGEQIQGRREHRAQRRDFWGGWRQDARYALRTLAKDRGFAVVTVLILALGIAANTGVFSVVNTVLLRPLPFPDSGRLVWLTGGRHYTAQLRETAGLSAVTYTVDAFEEIQRRSTSFERLASYNPFLGNGEFTLAGRGEPRALAGVMVDGDFFETLGVKAVLGRVFTPAEVRKGFRGVLLSYPLWQSQFGGDPHVIGQSVTLRQQSASVAGTVIGVLPASFDFGSVFAPGVNIDIFVPAIMDDVRDWGNTLALVGRLKPGVSVGQAQAELDVLIPRLQAEHNWFGDYTSVVTALKEHVSGKLHRALVVLWCAVGLILLIVCVNLSNLMLARIAARNKEFAMRAALGAGRGRLLRQLLTESLVLSGAGAALGLALAYTLTHWLAHQGSIALPLLSSVRVDAVALAWTVATTLAVAVLFGVLPGIHLGSIDLQSALKDSGHGTTTGRTHEHLRSILVASEIALACVLLVGAGLLLRSFLHVLDVDLGFRPANAAAIKIDYDDAASKERRAAVLEEILRNVSAIPGVEAAGITDMLPLGRNRSWGLSAKGVSYAKDETLAAVVRIVTPGYLGAMGMRLKEGRDFSWRDSAASDRVVIINQAAARRFWRGENPLGRLARVSGRDAQVIGVMENVREHNLEDSAGPEMYLSTTQYWPEGAELVIRTKLPPSALSGVVMQTLRRLNPAQPATELRPLQEIVDRSASPRRFFVMLVGSFAVLGMLLASLGIYGVVSYSVTRQRQEIGIRMALGATAPQVRRRVLANTLKLAGIGVASGAVAALAAGRWIESLLFGTEPADPLTFATIVVALLSVALVAGYVPARRASKIDPIIALRAN